MLDMIEERFNNNENATKDEKNEENFSDQSDFEL